MNKTYFWDFFGPRAHGTAEHFQRHLLEFLDKHALAGCVTALLSEGAGHHAVSCLTPPEAQEIVERALRPRRSLDGE